MIDWFGRKRIAELEAEVARLQSDFERLHTLLIGYEQKDSRWNAKFDAELASHQEELDLAVQNHGKSSGWWGRAAARATERAKAAEAEVVRLRRDCQMLQGELERVRKKEQA